MLDDWNKKAEAAVYLRWMLFKVTPYDMFYVHFTKFFKKGF